MQGPSAVQQACGCLQDALPDLHALQMGEVELMRRMNQVLCTRSEHALPNRCTKVVHRSGLIPATCMYYLNGRSHALAIAPCMCAEAAAVVPAACTSCHLSLTCTSCHLPPATAASFSPVQAARHVDLLQKYQASLLQATACAHAVEGLTVQRRHLLGDMLTCGLLISALVSGKCHTQRCLSAWLVYTTLWDRKLLKHVPCMPCVCPSIMSCLWCRSEQSNTGSSATLLHLYEQLRANVAGTLDTTAGITNARAQTAASQVRHPYASPA